MFKTCKSLESSLFCAPDEIRACCHRFFHKGVMRGDAKLIEFKNKDNKIEPKDIIKARQKLLDQIQNGENKQCLGCDKITKTQNKPIINSDVEYLSVEHHSFCNLRCTYCSDVFYGGQKTKYKIEELVEKLEKKGNFKKCHQVVWGGGEPTLDKSFENIFNKLDKKTNPKIYHRVFTNSVRFSEPLYNFIKSGKVKIVTSVDAGTSEKFKKIRGRDKLNEVFINLQKYSSIDPNKITIKYIFTKENRDEAEIDSFIYNCKSHGLNECNYQISHDYKEEDINLNTLKSIFYLYGRLFLNNIFKVFIDDHFIYRFNSLDDKKIKEIIRYLEEKKMNNLILNNKNIDELIIYGAGEISKHLIKKTKFIKKLRDFDVVDGDKKKIGTDFFGKRILSPESLRNDKRKVFIAAAQSYDDIIQEITHFRGDSNSVINGIFF
tara:strand:+ start:375 stop:1676 length:1302 start_codon:yes stop_codon:yes gene_type:complete